MDNEAIRQTFKIMIAEAGAFLAILWCVLIRVKPALKTRLVFDGALVLVAVAACVAYFEFGWLRYGRYMNPHDVYHYYMGAKYSREHQYYDLYRATLVADAELGTKYTEARIRNLNDHSYEPAQTVLRDRDRYRALFTPERWEEFKTDVQYWRTVMPGYKWNALLQDKGYNATPVWNAIARFFTEHVPTGSVWGMRFLTYIDLAMLAAMFAAIGFTFGWRIMLFAIIFHGTNYFMSFVHIKGAFMRLDWLATLVLSVCAIKRRRYGLAGALAGYAGMARVFPLILLFPLGVRALYNAIAVLRDRLRRPDSPARLDWNYTVFFAALVLTSLVLVGGSALSDGGFGLWQNFLDKIEVHNSDISTNRAGFKYIFTWGQANRAAYFAEHRLEWNLILGAVLLMTAFLTRRTEDYESIPLGFLPAFFLIAPTFYYFAMLLVPLLLFLPKVKEWDRAAGAAIFIGLSSAAHALGFFMPHNFPLFYYLSCMMLFLCAYMAFCVVASPVAVSAGAPVEAAAATDLPSRRRTLPAAVRNAGLAGLAFVLIVGAALAVHYYFRTTASDSEALRVATLPERNPADGVELVFTGDVMLSRNVARAVQASGKSFSFPFELGAPYTQAADLAFCNLECPISGRGVPIKKTYLFNAPTEAIQGIQFAGFDVVSLANNHILDYGPEAMDDTMRIVGGQRIAAIGITTEDDPQTPFFREVRGVRIAYLAYCDPVPTYSYAREFYVFPRRPARATKQNLARDIAAVRGQADIVVVSLHWGVEYVMEPDAHQRELGRYIIDLGAHIVAGHHQHVQQEPEVYKHGLILHGMGNYVFDQHSRPPTRESRIYRVYVNKEGIVRSEYLPLEIQEGIWQPRPKQEEFVRIQ